jgi:hypothetical protein
MLDVLIHLFDTFDRLPWWATSVLVVVALMVVLTFGSLVLTLLALARATREMDAEREGDYRPSRLPIDDVLVRYPEVFSLAGHHHRLFKISRQASRVDATGAARLVILKQQPDGDWQRFATMTIQQLDAEWRPIFLPGAAGMGA